jgi:ADP-ribosylglycohydrolase
MGRCAWAAALAVASPIAGSEPDPALDPVRVANPARITVQDYREKVLASWLGQIIGNIYGLSYEFRFIEEPGPDDFPYGFGASLDRVRDVDGAFSDDDTDIEYMYVLQMERHGIEPTYRQLSEAWKHHVRDRVWVANRSALTLMHAGYGPPLTGHRDYNPNWFQIDPQLVNEIWAVTAPGMLEYATQKSAWAARITNDGFGIEPTIHYAAMYAAAFFEKDIQRLVDIGTSALPQGSRFAATVEHMKRLHRQYPDDWREARRRMAEAYYREFDYNRRAWPVVDANLNGACGILALLYGEGDFQRTLDLASGMGFDADNQAATMSGLLGIVHGLEGIPQELLFPLGREEWDLPFNDRYINVSRHDLPDASLQDIARRMALQGERVILQNGGRMLRVDGVDFYEIVPSAAFEAPFELATAPTLLAEAGREFAFRLYSGVDAAAASYRVAGGALPEGVALAGDRISGVPAKVGSYPFEIEVSADGESRRQGYSLRVHGRNLANRATAIISNPSPTDDDIEVIRDGRSRGMTYYNRAPDGAPRLNWYGYAWEEPQTVSTLVYNPGLPEEWGGWFTSLAVEYRDAAGEWRRAELRSLDPGMDFDNSQWLKGAYIDHSLSIVPVTTTAIRIIGEAGGIEQDQRNGGERRFYTAISELAVYSD